MHHAALGEASPLDATCPTSLRGSISLVDRREHLVPLAREDLGVLFPLVPGKLLSSPELHEEYSSNKVNDG